LCKGKAEKVQVISRKTQARKHLLINQNLESVKDISLDAEIKRQARDPLRGFICA
jgi:hypothetical protein